MPHVGLGFREQKYRRTLTLTIAEFEENGRENPQFWGLAARDDQSTFAAVKQLVFLLLRALATGSGTVLFLKKKNQKDFRECLRIP
ncbi:MAG: hypothetical protein J1E79_07030 [Rikenella sp.]|nr:hypothetical protein [Rikenella sp.]